MRDRKKHLEVFLGMEQQGISLGDADYDQTYVQLQQVIQAENEYKKSLLNADAGGEKAKASADKLRDSVNGAGKAAKNSGKDAALRPDQPGDDDAFCHAGGNGGNERDKGRLSKPCKIFRKRKPDIIRSVLFFIVFKEQPGSRFCSHFKCCGTAINAWWS